MAKQSKKTETVTEAWRRIEVWIQANAPSEFSLPLGASKTEIKQAEAAMGLELPGDVRESYALHNGSNRIWFFEAGYLMPLKKPGDVPKREQARIRDVVQSRKVMIDMLERGYFNDSDFKSHPKGPIRTHWWNPKWIPITCNDSGDYACIDLDPLKAGHVGQVIDWWHERGATSVLAKSFTECLSALADRLEAGHCRFDQKTRAIKAAE